MPAAAACMHAAACLAKADAAQVGALFPHFHRFLFACFRFSRTFFGGLCTGQGRHRQGVSGGVMNCTQPTHAHSKARLHWRRRNAQGILHQQDLADEVACASPGGTAGQESCGARNLQHNCELSSPGRNECCKQRGMFTSAAAHESADLLATAIENECRHLHHFSMRFVSLHSGRCAPK